MTPQQLELALTTSFAHLPSGLASYMPAVMSMQYNRDCKELAHTCFAHPTVSEALKEAAMKVSMGNFIHM
eukprot:g2391.t1